MSFLNIKSKSGLGAEGSDAGAEMGQQLTTLDADFEDHSRDPSSQTPVTLAPRDLVPSSDPSHLCTLTHECRHTIQVNLEEKDIGRQRQADIHAGTMSQWVKTPWQPEFDSWSLW